MTTIHSLTSVELDEILIRVDVDSMSNSLFGLSYVDLKKLIYPIPRYKSFPIKKRSGALRIIDEPKRRLKEIQEKFLEYLYEHAGVAKPCVHGFTPERSILTNAKMHCSPKTHHLLNIDIQDFFPTITFYRVRGLLQKKPFEFSYAVATVLAHLCTYKGSLPQGAPTSPLLANLVCRSLDRDLMILAKRHRATYTRYADDITFSFSVRRSDNLPTNICSYDSGALALGHELKTLFDKHSFGINAAKSRISTRLHRLEVTGITINEFPNVKRIFIDRIRGALHAWEKYGYDHAQALWEKRIEVSEDIPYENLVWKRQKRNSKLPALKHVLWGKLLYLRMIRGKDDVIYTKLAYRFNQLCASKKASGKFSCPTLPVDLIVQTQSDAENATFIVEWMGNYKIPGTDVIEMVGGQATAFAYKNIGLITCNHALNFSGNINNKYVETDFESEDISSKELLIVHSVTQKSWPAKILYRNAHLDLAIITFDQAIPPAHHYFSGMAKPMRIGREGILIGFPNHSAGKSANFLRESVLNRYARTGLQRFEITGAGSIRQGNSGGPFVDQNYRIAGVAQQGAKQDSGNDECLCVTELDKWLADKTHNI